MSAKPAVSLIIPALDAAAEIGGTVAAWRDAVEPNEIVVADGGSKDGTAEAAKHAGATVVAGVSGRGRQLALGAARAPRDSNAGWLLFAHADTRPGPGAGDAVRAHLADPANAGYAAAFRLRLDDPDPGARRIERLANWRSRALGLPYGDQGLLISRALYDAVGGYAPMPLMEDVDLARRLGKARLRLLDAAVVTSAARYRRGGYWRRPARNLALLALYFMGVPPKRLLPWYG